MHKMSYFY